MSPRPRGIATQPPGRRRRPRLAIEKRARRLDNVFRASVQLMQVMARACGRSRRRDLCQDDPTTLDRDVACLTEVRCDGVVPL